MDNSEHTEGAGRPADNTLPAQEHPTPWRFEIDSTSSEIGYLCDAGGEHISMFFDHEFPSARRIAEAVNAIAAIEAARADWLAVAETGVRFTRFRTADRRVLVAHWRAPESARTKQEHLYEIEAKKLAGIGSAKFSLDGGTVFSLTATTVTRAENLALAAAKRYIARSHRRARRTARKAAVAGAGANGTQPETNPEHNTDTNTTQN